MFSIQFHTPVSKGQIKLAKTSPDDLKLKVTNKKDGGVKKTVCDLCNYKCRSNPKLNEHMNTRHGTQVSVTGLKHNGLLYLCVHCGFECKQKYSIVSHIDRNHDKTTFHCRKCDYVAKCKSNLSWHMRRKHEKEITNPCNICNFQSIRVELLRKHMAKHRENNLKCGKCDFICKFRRTLTKHMKSNHEMNWRCPICHLYVISSSALKTHKTQEHIIKEKTRYLKQKKTRNFKQKKTRQLKQEKLEQAKDDKSKNEAVMTASFEHEASSKTDSAEIGQNILDIASYKDALSASAAVENLLEIFEEKTSSEIEPLILVVEKGEEEERKCFERKNQNPKLSTESQRTLGPSLFVVQENVSTKNDKKREAQDEISSNLKGEIAMLSRARKKRKVYRCKRSDLETVSWIQHKKHMETPHLGFKSKEANNHQTVEDEKFKIKRKSKEMKGFFKCVWCDFEGNTSGQLEKHTQTFHDLMEETEVNTEIKADEIFKKSEQESLNSQWEIICEKAATDSPKVETEEENSKDPPKVQTEEEDSKDPPKVETKEEDSKEVFGNEPTVEVGPLCQNISEDLTHEQKIESLIEKEEAVFKCKECGKTATQRAHMKYHVEKHIEGVEYKCKLCSSVHKTRNRLNGHMYHHHRGMPKECNYCDFKTPKPRNLRIHKLTKHQGHARNAVVAAIKLISEMSPKKRSFSCDKCTFKSVKPNRLREHQQTRHEGLIIECDKCGNHFGRKDILKRHIQILHSDKPKPACDQCNFTTTTEAHLKEHKGRIHELKGSTTTKIRENSFVYQCNYCNMTFRKKKLMSRHTNTFHAEGATKHPCDECDAEFDSSKHLKLHKKSSHNSQGIGDVRLLCPKACTEKAGLSHHLKFYHEEIRNECDKCNFWTTKPRQLIRHNDNMHSQIQKLQKSIKELQ